MTTTEWKCLQPEKLSINLNAATAEDEWKFWHKTFTNYIEAMPRGENALNKLNLLTAYLTAPVYKLICELLLIITVNITVNNINAKL